MIDMGCHFIVGLDRESVVLEFCDVICMTAWIAECAERAEMYEPLAGIG
jgi:hypothetical protein